MQLNDKGRERLRDLSAMGALLLISAFLFSDILFVGNGFFLRDLTAYHFPMKHLVREAIRSGEFPYWNRYFSAGQPMAANPAYEIFYPPQWLVLLPSYRLGFQLHILIHIAIGLGGMFALLRSRLSRGASVFGTISFALGGAYLSLVNLLPTLFSFAWTPWVLLFARRFVEHRRPRDVAAGALCMGMQFLVGEPATILQTMLILIFVAIYDAPLVQVGKRFMLVMLLAAVAMCVGAAQLVPTIDFVPDTVRGEGFDQTMSGTWSMPLVRPLELVYPRAFGRMEDNGTDFWGAKLYPERNGPYLFSLYCGLFVPVLVLSGLLARSRGWLMVLVAMGAAYLLAIGRHSSLFDWLFDVGFYSSIRFPERFALLGIFALVLFAAVVFDRVQQGDRRLLKVAIAVSLVLAAIAIVMTSRTFANNYEIDFARRWGLESTPSAARMAVTNRHEWVLAAIRGLVIAGLLLWRLKRSDRAWFGAVALYVFADVGLLANALLPRMPRQFFDPPPVASQLPRGPDNRIFHLASWRADTPVGKTYLKSTGLDGFWVVRNGMFPYVPARSGHYTVFEPDIDRTLLSTTESLYATVPAVARARPGDWLQRFAFIARFRFYARFRPFEEAIARAGGRVQDIRPVVFVGTSPNPRYYFADRLVAISGPTEFVRELSGGSFTPAMAAVSFPIFNPTPGRVLSVRETANTSRLEVVSTGRSFLVAGVSFHRYWSATVDGSRTQIHRTNLAYQGIVLPPGRHEVRLVYRNPLILPSLVVSLITVATLIGLLFRGGGEERERRRAFEVNRESDEPANPAS